MEFPFNEWVAMAPAWGIPVAIAAAVLLLGYAGAGIRIWVATTAVFFFVLGASNAAWIILIVVAVVFGISIVRRQISALIMRVVEMLKFLPPISQTEQEAIDAGTVWVEGELFSGKPDFKRILDEGYPGLSEKEQAFLDGPVQEICDSVDDWDVYKNRRLPQHAWELLKKHRLFGMIISEDYGGHGFSASANSAVVGKMAAANTTLGITVMVPNSLGPAELLTHYGTQKQKDYYLPRLASHEEIPAFGLTEPQAGSDAGAISSSGVVFRGEDGELYLRLNWKKRYITLISVATVIGLAFKLRDPENLLGLGVSPGITCALIKTDAPGVDNSRRHDPMGIPFHNGPTTGTDVILPLEDAVIGGVKGVGLGWKMLMESLAAGRGISLPATSTFSAKMVSRVVGAHGVIRRQFGLSIGKFEGVEEKLAEIAGFTYAMEAARRYTNGALDAGAKPAVVTAIMKYNATELFRKIINNGMDVLGGNAISTGPRNALALSYINTPIGITVEGANILTRTLIIFGQGAIRSHRYILQEIDALTNKDVSGFDKAFWGHVGLVVRNLFRAILLSITRGRLASSPVSGPSSRYFRKLAWASASFAIMADVALFSLGGELKRKEKLTGRYADIFSWLYFGAAVLKRFEAEGRRKEDEPFLRWAMDYAFAQIQIGFDGLYANFKIPGLTWIFKGPIGLWSRANRFSSGPSDTDGHKISVVLQTPGERRDRLTDGIFLPSSDSKPLGRLDKAMSACYEADKFLSEIKKASRAGSIKKDSIEAMVEEAVLKNIISSAERDRIMEAEALRDDAIQVDDFSIEEYKLGLGRNTVEQ